MVQRYAPQVQEAPPKPAYEQFQGWADPIPRAVGQFGESIGALAAAAQKKQDEEDDLSALEAHNIYARQQIDLRSGVMNTPEFQGGHAKNAPKYFDDRSLYDADLLAKNLNPRAARKFRVMAWDTAWGNTQTVYKWAESEFVKYRDDTWKAHAETAVANALTSLTPDSFENAIAAVDDLIHKTNPGASSEAKQRLRAVMSSDVASQYIGAVAAEYGEAAAHELLNRDGKDGRFAPGLFMTQDARDKWNEKFRGEMELREAQEFAAGHIKKFPPGMERQGVKDIRSKYQGEKAEKFVSMYGRLVNEQTIRQSRERGAESARQKAFYNGLARRMESDQLAIPTYQEIDDAVLNGDISPAQGHSLKSRLAAMAKSGRMELRLAAEYGDKFTKASKEEQERMVLNGLGVPDGQMKAEESRLGRQIIEGKAGEDDIKDAVKDNRITETSGKRMAEWADDLRPDAKKRVKRMASIFEANINRFTARMNGKAAGKFKKHAKDNYSMNMTYLDPEAGNFDAEEKRIQDEAFVFAWEKVNTSISNEEAEWFEETRGNAAWSRQEATHDEIRKRTAAVIGLGTAVRPDFASIIRESKKTETPAAARKPERPFLGVSPANGGEDADLAETLFGGGKR